MTYLEIDKALFDISIDMIKECQDRVNSVSKENKNEHKALMVELGMYQFCRNAGFLGSERERVIEMRTKFIGQILPRYPEMNKVFANLSRNAKMAFIAALQAEIFIRHSVCHSYHAELEQAKATGDAKNIFEFGIKVGAVERVFAAWEAWRVEHDVYPGMFEEGLR